MKNAVVPVARWAGLVLFTPATTLAAQFAKAHADGRLEERLIRYAKPKLRIVEHPGPAFVVNPERLRPHGRDVGL